MTRILGSSRSAIVASRRVRRPEHAGPFVEWQIAGDDGGAALVALAEDLKQQLGAGRRQGDIAELIDDQQLASAASKIAGSVGSSISAFVRLIAFLSSSLSLMVSTIRA